MSVRRLFVEAYRCKMRHHSKITKNIKKQWNKWIQIQTFAVVTVLMMAVQAVILAVLSQFLKKPSGQHMPQILFFGRFTGQKPRYCYWCCCSCSCSCSCCCCCCCCFCCCCCCCCCCSGSGSCFCSCCSCCSRCSSWSSCSLDFLVFLVLLVLFVLLVLVFVVLVLVLVFVVVLLLFFFLFLLLFLFVFLLLPLQFFSQSRNGRKSSNSWCFRIFVKLSEPKKHRKYRCFCASEAKNHGMYDVFCFW